MYSVCDNYETKMSYLFDETTPAPNDTLVLRITEQLSSTGKDDTDIYVIYDTFHKTFLIRGKRPDTRSIKSKSYSFECDDKYSVYEFLSFIIPSNHKCVVELYSYRNLPSDKNDISFYLLRNQMNVANEVVAFVNQKLSYKKTRKMLSILQYTKNEYTP